jgi:hypothetical protein
MTSFRRSSDRAEPAPDRPGVVGVLGPGLVITLVALALGSVGCKNQPDPPPPAAAPVMSATEIKRGQDACKAYVDKVCGCAASMPALQQPCALSRALPDALAVGVEVAASADSSRIDALQAGRTARGIFKECLEQLAKLPAAGCP